MISGLYAIVHLPSQKTYLGSSVDCRRRLRAHRAMLRRGEHPNIHLQRAWNKFGESYFRFYTLLAVPPQRLRVAEEQALALWKPKECYNCSPVVHTGSLGSNSKLTPAQVRSLVRKAKAGVSNTDLAKEYGIHKVSVSRIIRGRTWKALDLKRPADQRTGKGRAKLNYRAVAVIRQRLARGETTVALGKEYGVTSATIAHIKHGRTYVSHPSKQF